MLFQILKKFGLNQVEKKLVNNNFCIVSYQNTET